MMGNRESDTGEIEKKVSEINEIKTKKRSR